MSENYVLLLHDQIPFRAQIGATPQICQNVSDCPVIMFFSIFNKQNQFSLLSSNFLIFFFATIVIISIDDGLIIELWPNIFYLFGETMARCEPGSSTVLPEPP